MLHWVRNSPPWSDPAAETAYVGSLCVIATPLRDADTTHGGAWFPHHSEGKMPGRAGAACAGEPASGSAKLTRVRSPATSTGADFLIAPGCRRYPDLSSTRGVSSE